MDEKAVKDLIEKNPLLRGSKDKLAEMQVGAYCIHQSWGFGQIKEYREDENRLVIDFDEKPGHSMDPAFCVNTMEVLPADHVLSRQRSQPEEIDELVKKDPVELVIQTLAHYPNRAATVLELESVYTRLLGKTRFRKWWTSTKKALANDPRVGIPLRRTECYFVREEPMGPDEEILENYANTKSAKRKLKLAKELVEFGKAQEELHNDLKGVINDLNNVIKESHQINPSERLEAAWVRNDLCRIVGIDPHTVEPTSRQLIEDRTRLESIGEGLPVVLQKRFIKLIKETFPGEWKGIVMDLLKNSEGKFTTECVNFLIENDCSNELKSTLGRWLTEQNLRAPVLHWICKNRSSRKYAAVLQPLVGPKLLFGILFALENTALQHTSTRKIPLAEVLMDDRDLIPDLLASSDLETARDLTNSLMLNQAFDDLSKKSLLARIIRLFPSVQSVVAGAAQEKEERLVVSRPSYNRRREEYDLLITEKIPENSKAIAAAMEHGDLRENSEYKMAKQDQQMLMARKMQLELDLAKAEVAEFGEVDTEAVNIGTTVELEDPKTSESATYHIMGAWDGDVDRNIISYQTPLGQSLLNHKVGDTVTLKVENNEEVWTIKSIRKAEIEL
ncbi:MAG: transcription elongation factor GreA [Opitutales bacterium]|nr:transcription elongation factor GreA [Opitutales bacterium]MCH8541323.1 transcription elongation factor GreA [Opitutales bacterium]